LTREIFFGTEEDEGVRFVKLHDCNHAFVMTSLDEYIDNYATIDSNDGMNKKVLDAAVNDLFCR